MLRTAGFSLLELVAGLALTATVAGSATLALPPVVAKIRLAGAAHRLAAALRQARGRGGAPPPPRPRPRDGHAGVRSA